PATTGTVLIAVLPIILGFQLLIQAISLDISDIPTKVQISRLVTDDLLIEYIQDLEKIDQVNIS
ncbi:MAG: hypothetical protein CVU43_19450, partial [Chloroflexi bacterium HGW-Chloroflexi-5]